jgi:molybdopterin/thiamine biosynthesis adenylyltransferase
VDLSNLPRQLVHAVGDIGRAKVESAADFVAALNPHVTVVRHAERIEPGNADALVAPYDIIIDGTDNIETRRTIARAASSAGKMLVSGAVSMFDGQVTVFPPAGPGYPHGFLGVYPEDIGPGDLPSCEAVGVLGATAGVIGTLMAMEAIKLATGLGQPLVGRLLLYDGQGAHFAELTI